MSSSSGTVVGGDDHKRRTENRKAKQGTMIKPQTELQISGGVNVHAIEGELRHLWEQMAETSRAGGQQPVMRVCVLNLVVYTPGQHAAGEVSQIMAEVTTQHPSRIFVIHPTSGTSESPLGAWVTAVCHLSADGHKQVCSEQIMITAQEDAVDRLPSLVRSLLVPDLPVVLWWHDMPNFESRLFAELAEASDRVIIDSAMVQDSEQGMAALGALIKERQQWTAFIDLSWSRLTPWRVAVAGFFDTPDCRAYLGRLNRVEIECTRRQDTHRSIPSQALLLACWLGSRLRWHLASKAQWSGDHSYQLELASENCPIEIQIGTSGSAKGNPGEVGSVRLFAEGERSARFVVARSEDDLYLQSDGEVAGTKLAAKAFPLGDRHEAQLISKELEILDHDVMFEQALAFFASIP